MDGFKKHGIIKLSENEKKKSQYSNFYVSVYCHSLRGDSCGKTECREDLRE